MDFCLLKEGGRWLLLMISYNDARTIIEEVVNGVSKWRDIASGLGISKREIDMFQHVYSKRIDC